jgi:hypothetical protein
MIVFFRARAEFTENINRDFWRKLRKNRDPFHTLTAVGGSKNGHFTGSLAVDLEEPTDDAMAYEITAALVQKVELLSRVGVAHIEFDEITVGVA